MTIILYYFRFHFVSAHLK